MLLIAPNELARRHRYDSYALHLCLLALQRAHFWAWPSDNHVYKRLLLCKRFQRFPLFLEHLAKTSRVIADEECSRRSVISQHLLRSCVNAFIRRTCYVAQIEKCAPQ